MASNRGRLVFPMAFFCLCPAAVRAQDSQYWTLQYGPVAALLGGVVVGSTRDLSATFYNPGALALDRDSSLLASVASFQATSVKATADVPVLDFQSTEVRPAPSLFSFAIPQSWTGSHTLAISTLTRQNFDLRTDNWIVTPSHQAGAEALFDQHMSESWLGISWAHKVGQDFGIGLTTYGAYRGQRTRAEVSGEAAQSPSQGGSALLLQDFDYSNYRLLWKAGVATHRKSWDFGLTVTTSSVGLFGSGSASYVRSAVGADLGSGPGVNVSVQHQDGLASHYQSPWSVAAGTAYRLGANTFHATVEWFDHVAGFDVLDPTPFLSDPAAASLLKRLHQEAKSVVNFGFGYQRQVNERFSFYGAFTTDSTFADKSESGTASLSTWDIYHLTAGTSLEVRSVKLTMGAAYSYGSDARSVSVILVPPGGPAAADRLLDAKFSRLTVLVGFDFGH